MRYNVRFIRLGVLIPAVLLILGVHADVSVVSGENTTTQLSDTAELRDDASADTTGKSGANPGSNAQADLGPDDARARLLAQLPSWKRKLFRETPYGWGSALLHRAGGEAWAAGTALSFMAFSRWAESTLKPVVGRFAGQYGGVLCDLAVDTLTTDSWSELCGRTSVSLAAWLLSDHLPDKALWAARYLLNHSTLLGQTLPDIWASWRPDMRGQRTVQQPESACSRVMHIVYHLPGGETPADTSKPWIELSFSQEGELSAPGSPYEQACVELCRWAKATAVTSVQLCPGYDSSGRHSLWVRSWRGSAPGPLVQFPGRFSEGVHALWWTDVFAHKNPESQPAAGRLLNPLHVDVIANLPRVLSEQVNTPLLIGGDEQAVGSHHNLVAVPSGEDAFLLFDRHATQHYELPEIWIIPSLRLNEQTRAVIHELDGARLPAPWRGEWKLLSAMIRSALYRTLYDSALACLQEAPATSTEQPDDNPSPPTDGELPEESPMETDRAVHSPDKRRRFVDVWSEKQITEREEGDQLPVADGDESSAGADLLERRRRIARKQQQPGSDLRGPLDALSEQHVRTTLTDLDKQLSVEKRLHSALRTDDRDKGITSRTGRPATSHGKGKAPRGKPKLVKGGGRMESQDLPAADQDHTRAASLSISEIVAACSHSCDIGTEPLEENGASPQALDVLVLGRPKTGKTSAIRWLAGLTGSAPLQEERPNSVADPVTHYRPLPVADHQIYFHERSMTALGQDANTGRVQLPTPAVFNDIKTADKVIWCGPTKATTEEDERELLIFEEILLQLGACGKPLYVALTGGDETVERLERLGPGGLATACTESREDAIGLMLKRHFGSSRFKYTAIRDRLESALYSVKNLLPGSHFGLSAAAVQGDSEKMYFSHIDPLQGGRSQAAGRTATAAEETESSTEKRAPTSWKALFHLFLTRNESSQKDKVSRILSKGEEAIRLRYGRNTAQQPNQA